MVFCANECCLRSSSKQPRFYTLCISLYDKKEYKTKKTPKLSIWKSRTLEFDGEQQILYCHGRFVAGLTEAKTVDFEVKMRIRAQLLDQMIQDIRTKSSRLGTIQPHSKSE